MNLKRAKNTVIKTKNLRESFKPCCRVNFLSRRVSSWQTSFSAAKIRVFSNFQARHAIQQVPYRVFEFLLNDQVDMQCSLSDVGTQTRVRPSLAIIF